MATWLRRLLILVLLVAAFVVVQRTLLRPEPVPVTVFRAARGLVEETVTNSRAGTVKTRYRAGLSPALAGRVAEIPAREGDRVREGDVILRLDDAEYRASLALQERALESARSAMTEACVRAEQADRDLARTKRLARDRVVSEDALEQAQSAAEVAHAACTAARSEVSRVDAVRQLAEVSLDRTVLRAPFDGVVAEVSAEVGEWITPSPPGVHIPPVIDLISPDEIFVSAPLDEVDVGRVDVGLPVRVTLDPFPDRTAAGSVSRVAPYVEDAREESRTFEIEVELSDHDFARRLRPGTTADVEVILRAKRDVLRVPSYALLEGGRVLLVREGELVAVDVQAGLRNWEFVEIVEGLDAGEAVVVSLDRAEVQEGASAVIAGETLK